MSQDKIPTPQIQYKDSDGEDLTMVERWRLQDELEDEIANEAASKQASADSNNQSSQQSSTDLNKK